MKEYKFLLIILFLFICTGCQTNNELNNSAKRISDKIVENIQSDDVSLKKLTKKEKDIYNSFVESQKRENYIVNLNNVELNSMNDYYNTVPNSDEYVYKEEDGYKIKYSNIIWLKASGTQYTTLLIDGERKLLYKSQVPLFNEETKDLPYYQFVYDFSNDYGKYIEFYYKSLFRDESFAQNTGVIVRVFKQRHKISNIELIYDNEYNPTKIENKSIGPTILKIVIGIFIGIIIVVGAVKLMRKV